MTFDQNQNPTGEQSKAGDSPVDEEESSNDEDDEGHPTVRLQQLQLCPRQEILKHWQKTGGQGDIMEDIEHWAANLLLTEGHNLEAIDELLHHESEATLSEMWSCNTNHVHARDSYHWYKMKKAWIVATVMSLCQEAKGYAMSPRKAMRRHFMHQGEGDQQGNQTEKKDDSRGRERKKKRKEKGEPSNDSEDSDSSPPSGAEPSRKRRIKKRSPRMAMPLGRGRTSTEEDSPPPTVPLGRGRARSTSIGIEGGPERDSRQEDELKQRVRKSHIGGEDTKSPTIPAESVKQDEITTPLGRGRVKEGIESEQETQDMERAYGYPSSHSTSEEEGEGLQQVASTSDSEEEDKEERPTPRRFIEGICRRAAKRRLFEASSEDGDPEDGSRDEETRASSETPHEESESEANQIEDIGFNQERRRVEAAGETPRRRSLVEYSRRRIESEEEPTVLSDCPEGSLNVTGDTTLPIQEAEESVLSIDPIEVNTEPDPQQWSGQGSVTREERDTTPGCSVPHQCSLGSESRITLREVTSPGANQPGYRHFSPVYTQQMINQGIHKEDDGSIIEVRIMSGTSTHPGDSQKLDELEEADEMTPVTKRKFLLSKMKKCTVNFKKGVLVSMNGAATRSRQRWQTKLTAANHLVDQASGSSMNGGSQEGDHCCRINEGVRRVVSRTQHPMMFGGQHVFMTMPAAMDPQCGVRRFICEMDGRIPQIALDLQCRMGSVARIPFHPRDEELSRYNLYLIIDRKKWTDPPCFPSFKKGVAMIHTDAMMRGITHLTTINPPRSREMDNIDMMDQLFEDRFRNTTIEITIYEGV